MQKVLLVGYLGRDPEVKYSQQGTAVAQFPVAVTEHWKDKSGQLQEHTENPGKTSKPAKSGPATWYTSTR